MTLTGRFRMFVLMIATFMRRDQIAKALATSQPRPLAYQPDWLIGWGMLSYEGDRRPGARRFYAACCTEWAERQRIRKLAGQLAQAADKITKG